MFQVTVFDSLSGWEPLAPSWQQLAAGQPMRSFSWARLWWEHCATGADEPFVMAVVDHQQDVQALLPWYRQRHPWLGRVLRWVGDRLVATDHLDLLAHEPAAPQAIAQLAQFLLRTARGNARSKEALWDLIHLQAVPCAANHTLWLLQRLQSRGLQLWWRPDQGHWQLPLPESWEELLGRFSKGHRKQLRRLKRTYLDSGRVTVSAPCCGSQREHAFRLLVALHQKRWQSQGEPGCFASDAFTQFHRQVIQAETLGKHTVRLWHLMLDGKAVAAEYQLCAPGGWMLYQGGLDPQALTHQPGRLALVVTLLEAIRNRVPVLDFLRGDEPYKAHFRAIRYPCAEVRVLAPALACRLRHAGYLAAHRAKRLIRSREKLPAAEEVPFYQPADRRWQVLDVEQLARWLSRQGPAPLLHRKDFGPSTGQTLLPAASASSGS